MIPKLKRNEGRQNIGPAAIVGAIVGGMGGGTAGAIAGFLIGSAIDIERKKIL